MSDPGSTIESVDHGLPFRPRATSTGYQVFGD